MLDIPPDEARSIALSIFPVVHGEISVEEYQAAVERFADERGKYIRTLIIRDPDDIQTVPEAEQDFWALPAPCEGWQEAEKKLRQREAGPSK